MSVHPRLSLIDWCNMQASIREDRADQARSEFALQQEPGRG